MKKKICVLCGKEGANSADHIPPKGIIQSKYRGNKLITVPAHIECNKRWEKDDTYFRDNVVMTVSSVSEKARELLDAKVGRSLKRGQSEKYRQQLSKETSSMEIRTPSNLYLKTVQIKALNMSRTDAVVKRICRGLLFSMTKIIPKDSWPTTIDLVKPNYATVFRGKFSKDRDYRVVVKDVFDFFWKGRLENPEEGIFYLFFYEFLCFRVLSGNLVKQNKTFENMPESYPKFEGIKFSENNLWTPPGQHPENW